MHRGLTISLCLPCRNEGAHLRDVVKAIPTIVDEVIVISNRSTDDTVEVAKELGLRVIEDDRTLRGIGYGYALMTGFSAAVGDIVVGGDADGTYPFEDIARMIDALEDDHLDFISCNRYPLRDGTTIPWKLRLGVWLLNTEVRVLYGLRIQDILSGMWVFRATVVDDLALTEGDWNLSPQVKLNAARHPDIAFAERPIRQHQRWGASHQHYFGTGFSHARWILANRFA